jgi:hypothetical protein
MFVKKQTFGLGDVTAPLPIFLEAGGYSLDDCF